MNRQFTFEAKQKTFIIIMIVIGLASMGVTYFTDDELHTRFWTNFLHNTVFFTGISFMALFFLAASSIAYSGWQTVIKRLLEAYSLFLIVGLLLLGIIIGGLWFNYHSLYHWNDLEAVKNDEILTGKSSFLNRNWYTFGTIIIVGTWYLFAVKLRSLSIQEDESHEVTSTQFKSYKIFSAAFLPIAGFSSAAMIWQWLMSLNAHWYSTMYAWYVTASFFVAMLAMIILMLMYFQSKGMFKFVTVEHFHDLGKLLFAFSIFWTYLWFSQFMLIWYANVGEETIYFKERMDNYPVLFFGNIIINFVLVFLVLLRNDTKRKFGTLGFVAIIALVGHWIDFFQIIKPSALITAKEHLEHSAHSTHEAAATAIEHTAEHAETASNFMMGFTIPGLLEIGTLLGFLGLFLYIVFSQLSKASTLPKNDPYLTESLHHHV
ncbi:MAG: hypothetical protein KBA06_00055 [Saprospiraceae bacterium]|nr:hypothetical protein [Saprospiraceae bacterium]